MNKCVKLKMNFILKAEFISVSARGRTFIFPGLEVTSRKQMKKTPVPHGGV